MRVHVVVAGQPIGAEQSQAVVSSLGMFHEPLMGEERRDGVPSFQQLLWYDGGEWVAPGLTEDGNAFS